MSTAPSAEAGRKSWRRLLSPLAPVYAAAVALKNTAYTRRWLASERLQAPVISVGNLSVGGAGKTPLVIRLAELLAGRGLDVDVLSRGYGRQSRVTARVVTSEPAVFDTAAGRPGTRHEQAQAYDTPSQETASLDAELYGDEPLLIAQAAQVPVYVGVSRYAAGLLAEHQPVTGSARVHLLDDGFQHRQLARAVDIVVLHRSDFTGCLLPAGRLREPLSSLWRASIVVIRQEDASLEPQLRRMLGNLPVWLMTREIVLPGSLSLSPRAIAFCGIAHPAEFFESLTRAGVSLAATHAFRDHHAYTDADVTALARSVQASGAGILLTTEKDLIRLSAAHRAILSQAATLEAVPLRARLVEEDAAIDQLLALAGLPGG